MQMAWKESIVMNEISPLILIEMKMRCIFNMYLIEYTQYEHPKLMNKTFQSHRYIRQAPLLGRECQQAPSPIAMCIYTCI